MKYRDYLMTHLEYKYPNAKLLQSFNINFSNLKYLPKELIYKLKSKQIQLVIDLSQEGEIDFIQQIYDVIKLFKIPPKQIIFVCSSPDYKDEVLRIFRDEPICLEWFMYFELDQKRIFTSDIANNKLDYDYPNPLKSSTFDKVYLNLNRRWKSHREALITLLYDKKVLDKGYNSFSGKDFKIKFNEDISEKDDYASMYEDFNTQELRSIFQRSKELKNLFPLTLDTSNFYQPLALTTQRSLVKFYQTSYFSVITETLYNYPIRFLTEKIFRPISHKHPFILLAPPKSLELLKQLGYKTFNTVIDESYDNELDHNKRIMMVANEIERLCNLTNTELNYYRESLIPIVEHNYKNLMNRPQQYRTLI
jgi:hypothetical protein